MDRKNNLARLVCPECSNYFDATQLDNGITKGVCPICKSIVSSKNHSSKERIVKVIIQNKN